MENRRLVAVDFQLKQIAQNAKYKQDSNHKPDYSVFTRCQCMLPTFYIAHYNVQRQTKPQREKRKNGRIVLPCTGKIQTQQAQAHAAYAAAGTFETRQPVKQAGNSKTKPIANQSIQSPNQ